MRFINCLILILLLPTLNACFQEKEKSQEFKELVKILVQVRASASAGVNLQEWRELMKSYSIKADNYKLLDTPTEIEKTQLNLIRIHMGKVVSSWNLNDLDYSCRNKKEYNNSCAQKYVKRLAPIVEFFTEEELIKGLENKFSDETISSINDDINLHVRYNLGHTSSSIEDFFELHGTEL